MTKYLFEFFKVTPERAELEIEAESEQEAYDIAEDAIAANVLLWEAQSSDPEEYEIIDQYE